MGNEIAKYLYEIGQLKRVKRSGWWIAGIENPESVAEHSFRTAVIAYLLAELEGANAERATFMALFHDAAEARTNDLHRIARRYVHWENVDKKVVEDQSKRLPELIGRVDVHLESPRSFLLDEFFEDDRTSMKRLFLIRWHAGGKLDGNWSSPQLTRNEYDECEDN